MDKTKDHPFKKTNMPLPMKIFFSTTSLTLKTLGVISPKLAGKFALRLFMTPPNAKPPNREHKIRAEADLSYRQIKENTIAVRVWQKQKNVDAPTILLSHGWAGRSSQFLAMIEPLVELGYRVVGAEIPAHGESSGKRTNMLEASQVLSVIAEEFSPFKAIIGHSFGSGTALLALDKYQVGTPKLILIGAYSRVSFIIDLFSGLFNLNAATEESMLEEATNRYANSYGFQWDWESISPINTIKGFEGELLFLHDETDHEVPIEEVRELHQAKPNAQVIISSDLGHRRILRDKETVESILSFIQH